MNYRMEELVPIVAELAEQYTSRESSSITFEKAKQLMEAVLYCIDEVEKVENGQEALYDTTKAMEARVVYEKGYELVIDKVKRAKKEYNKMIPDFQSYRNRNYYDTVVKGMPAFFLYYDARFAPQNHILTLDYPLLRRFGADCGIDVVEQYISCITYEQVFMANYPFDYIIDVLSAYHEEYEDLFCNICSIVLRNILGCMMVKKPLLRKGFTREEIIKAEGIVLESSREELRNHLCLLLKVLIEQGYEGNITLYQYLEEDLEDFIVELKNAATYHSLDKILLL